MNASRVAASIQAFDALDQQDFPRLAGENASQVGTARRDLALHQRLVEVGAGELLGAETEHEVVGGENADHILRNGGFATASRSRYEDDSRGL